jgi:hypothetical protein
MLMRRHALLILPAVALFAAAACSSSGEAAAPATVTVTATPSEERVVDAAWNEDTCAEASMADWTEHCAEFAEDSDTGQSTLASSPLETPLGGTYQGERSKMTVTADTNYEFSKNTWGAENAVRAVLLTFTIENEGTEVMESYNFLQSVSFAGVAAESIADTDTATSPATDVLPGRSATWTTAYAIPTADPGELIVSTSFGMGDSIYFTGTV